jgi:hypothetical protein
VWLTGFNAMWFDLKDADCAISKHFKGCTSFFIGLNDLQLNFYCKWATQAANTGPAIFDSGTGRCLDFGLEPVHARNEFQHPIRHVLADHHCGDDGGHHDRPGAHANQWAAAYCVPASKYTLVFNLAEHLRNDACAIINVVNVVNDVNISTCNS